MKRHWVVLWTLWAARLVPQRTPEVQVSGGALRGAVAPDGSHRQYLAIPYATVGPHNRFQAADPEPKWNGVFDAVNENVRCPQRKGKSFVTGRENCLTLNVFTPLEAGQAGGELLPVMVFIHGGGFYDGSSSRHVYGPQYLVTKGVILVTVNYRLNLQGFACLRIKEAPGNAGLKDQVAALKWIRRNIAAFGGDAENVTIFGESAGAASVSYHVVSHMSQGLFHKAILQSGSSLAPWAMQYRPVYMASLMAKVMGYETENAREIYDIFQKKSDAELIVTRVPRLEGNVILSECLYVPCVEDRIEGVEPFLTEYPYDIYRKGYYNKVPMMIGFNSEEGYLFSSMENDTTIPKIKIEKSLPKDLTFPTEEERRRVAAQLQRLYFGDKEISQETLLQLAKYQGEAYFVNAVIEEIEYLLETNDKPVYSYIFGYGGNRNLAKFFSGEPYRSAPDASHADDLFYLFSQGVLPSLFENKMIDTMTTLWTNFAKFGDPTPTSLPEGADGVPALRWAAAGDADPRALFISEELRMTPLRYTETLKFWKTVYRKYRRKKP
ncbi:esterase FE4 [Papilio machaon]|uniref:esterase FE4 n=1 Tax=Papilio machaon TaxID=76193 RepID=UPI001E66451A|nr:esterase FE4 [Papilio machaon]